MKYYIILDITRYHLSASGSLVQPVMLKYAPADYHLVQY